MNLPNKLTMLRVLLIPVFMVCAANRWMLAAGIIFAAASLTDYFDGHLARKNNLVTDFGKFADPLKAIHSSNIKSFSPKGWNQGIITFLSIATLSRTCLSFM